MTVKQIDHLNLSTSNLQASLDFYRRVFDFKTVESGVQDGAPWAIIRSGDALLALYESTDRAHHDRFALDAQGLHGMNHFALRITDREAWLKTVDSEGLEISYGGVVEWPHSSSWYINDPTGYEIEVVHWENDQIDFAGQEASL